MSKVNFSRSEKAFQKAAEINLIQNLHRLAAAASASGEELVDDDRKKKFESDLKELQKEIKKLKETDLDLYRKLSLSPAEEEEIFSDSPELFEAIPEKLSALKDRLDRLNKKLDDRPNKEPGDSPDKDAVLEDQISVERREHVNKRLNVRKGWLPLK